MAVCRLALMGESLTPIDGSERRASHLFCLQLGSQTMRTFNDEDAEKGNAFFDVFAMADLTGLVVKEVETDEKEEVNGKRLRVEHTATQLGKAPRSFLVNSAHEEAVLAYLAKYAAAFGELYRHRRPLWTAAKNECGVSKFVCTTVRCPPLVRLPLASQAGM